MLLVKKLNTVYIIIQNLAADEWEVKDLSSA